MKTCCVDVADRHGKVLDVDRPCAPRSTLYAHVEDVAGQNFGWICHLQTKPVQRDCVRSLNCVSRRNAEYREGCDDCRSHNGSMWRSRSVYLLQPEFAAKPTEELRVAAG